MIVIHYSVLFVSFLGYIWASEVQTTTANNNGTKGKKSFLPARTVPTYRISTVLHSPWMMQNTDGKFEGFIVDLLEEVTKLIPFNYSLTATPDNSYGMVYHVTGEWGGVIGEIIAGKADIGAADLMITEDRSKVVFFTSPFIRTGAQILLKKPTNSHVAIATLLYPLTAVVWVMLLVAFVVVGGLFYLIERFSPYGWRNVPENSDKRQGRNSYNIANSYLFSISTLLWQGYREAPKCISGRILASFWWCFVVSILFSYSSNLTALFLCTGTTKPVLPFKTFSEMAQQSDVVYGGWFGLILNPNEQLQRTMDRFISSRYTHYQSIDEAVTRIRKSEGQFAAIVEGTDAEYIVRKHCDLILLREKLFSIQYGLACRRDNAGARLCAELSSAIMSLHDDGTIHMLQDKWWESGRTCPETAEDDYVSASNKAITSFRSLTISDVSFGFLLLVVGIVLSLVALGLEIIFHRRKNTNKEDENVGDSDCAAARTSPEAPDMRGIMSMLEQGNNKIENENYRSMDDET